MTLVFEDGRSIALDARADETVYSAALRQKVRLEVDCLEGACATCKAHCTQGEYELLDYSEEALSDAEKAEGFVLTCQMRAQSDCSIELPYESGAALAKKPVGTCPATVSAIERVSYSVVRLDLDTAAPVGFLPGQYVHLAVPGTDAKRSYSFANPPRVSQKHSFYVKLIEGGVMSTWVSERASPGDAITMTGPFGHFYIRQPNRPVLMLAGGTGLAPMLSMLEHLADNGGTTQAVRLLYGANTPAEFFCIDRLEALRGRGIPLSTERVALQGDASWSGATGHVTAHLRPEHVAGGCEAYLCGPPPMIDAARTWLRAQGVPESLIHAERFIAS